MAKILIVDDEFKLRQIYTRLLRLENHEVVEANDCPVAAQILTKVKGISLVLLDICMPLLQGDVLYRMIRMLDPHIKIIVTSVYSISDQKNIIPEADDYHDKSQATSLLLDKIKKVLGKTTN